MAERIQKAVQELGAKMREDREFNKNRLVPPKTILPKKKIIAYPDVENLANVNDVSKAIEESLEWCRELAPFAKIKVDEEFLAMKMLNNVTIPKDLRNLVFSIISN
jgi:hypothetical protein